mgnify:CR=1 FL=1
MNKEDYSKYYIQGSDHYLIPKDIFNELFNEMSNWREEAKELKKQLEEYKATNEVLSHELTKDKVLQQDCLTTCCGIPIGDIPKLITQQKEFINYLENGIDICDGFLDTVKSDLQEILYVVIPANKNITTRIIENETAHKIYEEILQKYKSIIGVLNETNIK